MNKKLIIISLCIILSFLIQCKSTKQDNTKTALPSHNHLNHDHSIHNFHNIIFTPFNKNKRYFERFVKSNRWKHKFCIHSESELKYIKWDFSDTKRPFLKNSINKIKYVPIFDPDTTIVFTTYMAMSTGSQKEHEVIIGSTPRLGSHGCNYFLATNDDNQEKEFRGNNKKNSKSCKLDSFWVEDKLYIHLLYIQHDSNGKVSDTVKYLTNIDFQINLNDYKKLDSILSKNKYVGGGSNNSKCKPLYIHIDKNGPIDSIFPQNEIIWPALKKIKVYDQIKSI